mgnify:CR=1 FL=1
MCIRDRDGRLIGICGSEKVLLGEDLDHYKVLPASLVMEKLKEIGIADKLVRGPLPKPDKPFEYAVEAEGFTRFGGEKPPYEPFLKKEDESASNGVCLVTNPEGKVYDEAKSCWLVYEVEIPDDGKPSAYHYLTIGDDAYLTDIDLSNMLGIFGKQDSTICSIKLGADGPYLHGRSDGNLETSGRIKDKTGFVMPVGAVIPYAGSSAPDGWMMCDGSTYDTSAFRDLFAVIGYTYGGSGSQFRVPDLRGRVVVCRDPSDGDFDNLNDYGGEKEHTLTIDEMPRHNHGGQTSTDGEHRHTIYIDTGSGGSHATTNMWTDEDTDGQCTNCVGDYYGYSSHAGDHHHTIYHEGGDQPHNNLQPYRVLNYIIKY